MKQAMNLREVDQLRPDYQQFLICFSEHCERNERNTNAVGVYFKDVGAELGLDEDRTRKIAHGLARRGMLKAAGMGGLYAITPVGLDTIANLTQDALS